MKNRYTPANPVFFYIKVGFKGVYFHGHVFLMYRRWTKVFVTFENSIDFNVFSCLQETLSCLFWSTYFHDFGVI